MSPFDFPCAAAAPGRCLSSFAFFDADAAEDAVAPPLPGAIAAALGTSCCCGGSCCFFLLLLFLPLPLLLVLAVA